MHCVKTTVIVCWVTVLALGLAASAGAQTSDDRTYLTFSGPVEVPGMTLPAGQYTFRLMDSPSNRHIIEVLEGKAGRHLTIFLALAAERRDVTDETVVTFAERTTGTPPAIRYWYYPGDTIGHEFVYPKKQAMRIARASNQPVAAMETESTEVEALKSAQISTVTPEAAAQTEESQSVSTTERQSTAAEPSTAARTTGATVGTSGRELPRTASPLPLAGALGLLSLGGAAIARRLRKRM